MCFCVRKFLEGEQMRLKDGFLLRKVAGEFVVVPTGDAMVDFKAMISLNETGAFLWELLGDDCDIAYLCSRMVAEYDIDEATAMRDIEGFLKILSDNDLME